MSNFARLKTLAIALYGESWQHAVARELGVHHRQVYRWVVGEYEPHDEHVAALTDAAKSRLELIGEALQSVVGMEAA